MLIADETSDPPVTNDQKADMLRQCGTQCAEADGDPSEANSCTNDLTITSHDIPNAQTCSRDSASSFPCLAGFVANEYNGLIDLRDCTPCPDLSQHLLPPGVAPDVEADGFTHIYSYNGGSGPLSVFRPAKGGFCSLGDIIIQQDITDAPAGTKASFVPASVGQAPTDFTWIGAENQAGGVNWWEPVCGTGFVAAGHVAVAAPESSQDQKPPSSSACCVPSNMVCEYQNADGVDDSIWNDPGTGGMDNCQWERKGLHTFVADISNCKYRFSPPCTTYYAACPAASGDN